MQSLEYLMYDQSLILLFKCIKENGPSYISNLFERRKSHYNLRNTDCNLLQLSYNNRFYHNSFTYKLSHLWNQSPLHKQSPNLSEFFRKKLKSFDFSKLTSSCKCNYCLSQRF